MFFREIDVAQTAAGLNHVLEHEFRRVLDAFFFLKRRPAAAKARR